MMDSSRVKDFYGPDEGISYDGIRMVTPVVKPKHPSWKGLKRSHRVS